MNKLHSHLKLYSFSFLMLGLLVSCGTMQTTTNNDGIYDDEIAPQRRTVSSNNGYQENYFNNELKRLDNLNGTDIFTDIEDYNSGDYLSDDNIDDNSPNNYEGWGNNNNSDVVVNVYDNYGWNNYYGNRFWGYNQMGMGIQLWSMAPISFSILLE